MIRFAAALVCSLFLFVHGLKAQEEAPSRRPVGAGQDSVRGNLFFIGIDKSFETLHWSGRALYKNTFGPLSLQFNEQYLSTIIQAEKTLITDNQMVDLHGTGEITPRFDAAFKISSFLLSDNKDVGINSAYSHAIYGGILLRPVGGVTIEPLIGRRIDRQLEHRDEGTSYLVSVTGDTIRTGGYIANLAGTFQLDELSPRRLETYAVAAGIGRSYDRDTRNQLRAVYNRNRRDFYLSADTDVVRQYGTSYNIETREDNSLGLVDSLDYAAGRGAMLTLAGSVVTRQIDRAIRYHSLTDPIHTAQNTGINELRMEGFLRGVFRVSDRIGGVVTVDYSERNEQHRVDPQNGLRQFEIDSLRRIEERKNNLSKRTIIAASAGAQLSESDSVEVAASGSILRYDTPSGDNHDDRDELWYVAGIATHHRLGSKLILHTSVDLSLTHMVYLSSVMSANNTWNRILRFSPKIEYFPVENFRTVNSFEVLANYTVYDFDVATAQTQSFIFRQFAWFDSTVLNCTNRLSLEGYAYLRFYERGELRWNEFLERPVDYFEDRTLIGTLRYELSSRLLFSLGVRYFSQMRYGFDGAEHVPISSLRSVGPTVGMNLRAGGRTEFTLNGWYERQTQTNQPVRGTTTLTMQLRVRI
jgi:hypothetical protein